MISIEEKMNKEDFTAACNDLLTGSTFSLINIQKKDNHYYNFVAADGQAKVVLSLTDPYFDPYELKNDPHFLNANSLLFFEKSHKQQAESLFQKYNYDFFNRVVSSCYEIGEYFGFYKSILLKTPFNLADGFDFKKQKITPKAKCFIFKYGDITFHPILVEQNTDNLHWIVKKSICVYVRFKIINNELHPFVLLTIPYSPRKNITFHLDLHSSFKPEVDNKLVSIKQEYTEALAHYMGILLKRYFKMKAKEIEQLSLEEKKDYLMIAHMDRI